MWDFTSERVFRVPGPEPETLIYYKPITEEQYAQLEGAVARMRRARLEVGGDVADSEAVRQMNESERMVIAGAVTRIVNVYKPGDEVTGVATVAPLIATMPTDLYRRLSAEMRSSGTIASTEGKASGSQCEPPQSSSESDQKTEA